MSRAKTPQEIRDDVFRHVDHLIRYWSTIDPSVKRYGNITRDRMYGLVFSICSMLDGSSDVPAFELTVNPHPDDKQYHIDNGDNWYEPGTSITDDLGLHEAWSAFHNGRKLP